MTLFCCKYQQNVPVKTLSFTIHVPVSKSASHIIEQPCGGIKIMSPGTNSLEFII